MTSHRQQIADLQLQLEQIINLEADYQDYYQDWQELSQQIQQLQIKIQAEQHQIDSNKPKIIYNPINLQQFNVNKNLYAKIEPAQQNITHYTQSLAALQRQINELNSHMQQLYQQIQQQQNNKNLITQQLQELAATPKLKIKVNK